MARRGRDTRIFYTLIRRLEPDLRAAFEAAIADLRAGVDFRALITALQTGNIEAAVLALNIEPAVFQRYAALKTTAYAEGGAATVASISLPGVAAAGVRFDLTNPAAERWIAENVGREITRVTQEQIAVVRDFIGAGYARGQGPQDIALDLAGRVRNGTRQGGVLGLDGPRAERLRAVTEGIKTPEGVRSLVIQHRDGTVSLRYTTNPATERAILAAYRRGEAVPSAGQQRIAAQFSNKLLRERAETVARTETAQAVMSSRRDAWTQIMDRRNIPPEAVVKRWIHGGSVKEPRPHHVEMSGQEVRGIDTPFVFSNGASLQMAHDPNGDASEIIYCGCNTEFSIDPAWRVESGSPQNEVVESAPDQKIQQSVLSKGRAANVEFLEAYDANTGISFSMDGTENNVSLPDRMLRAISDPRSSIVAHHNHPSSRSFSPQDLNMIGSYRGLSSLYAHGHDGSSYRADRVKSFGRSVLDEANNAVARPFLSRQSEFSSKDDMMQLFHHSMSQWMSAKGFIQYRASLQGETLAAYQRNKSIIDEIFSGFLT